MARYAVLLRGINVGKAKRVAMADLRALLADLGYTGVATILNSGNAVVTGPGTDVDEQAARIERAIEERLGVSCRCLVLPAALVREIVDGHPFADVADNGSRMMANILSAVPPVGDYDPVAADPEHTRRADRVIYQWCPDGVLAAPGIDEKRLGVAVTARNWNTMTKLVPLLEEA